MGVLLVSHALLDVSIWLAVVAGILGSLGVIAKSQIIGRPIRWVWRKLVTEPVAAWFRSLVHSEVVPVVTVAVEEQFRKLAQPNGGSSLRDLANALDRIEGRQRVITGEVPITSLAQDED